MEQREAVIALCVFAVSQWRLMRTTNETKYANSFSYMLSGLAKCWRSEQLFAPGNCFIFVFNDFSKKKFPTPSKLNVAF